MSHADVDETITLRAFWRSWYLQHHNANAIGSALITRPRPTEAMTHVYRQDSKLNPTF